MIVLQGGVVLSTLSDQQKKYLRVYDNLRYDAAHFVASANDPQNFAQILLDDFMQEGTFTDTIRSIATDFGRQDILNHIDGYEPLPQARFGAAVGLVAAIERGDDAMLVDLINQPAEPTYSLTALNTFWNVAANLQEDNPEVYTHLLADTRYVGIFDQTVSANEYDPETTASLRAEILTAHQGANSTLDDMEYDVFQMEYAGMADNLYDFLERNDFEHIGSDLTQDAPQTIFSGLQVQQPMSENELTAVTVSHDDYYGAIQSAKDLVAEQAANVLFLTDNFNTNVANIVQQTLEVTVGPELELEPEAEENASYLVQPGDNLWKIAQNEYGLTSYRDIMRAVEHIAHENGLSEGIQANHIDVGQELSMPSQETIAGPVVPAQELNWGALDADVAHNRQMALSH